MAKRTIKISIKLPAGVTATKELSDKAARAAQESIQASIDEMEEIQKLAKQLASSGYDISAEELAGRRKAPTKTKSVKKAAGTRSKGKRTRVVLNDEQRSALIEDLKKNELTVKQTAEKYGVSTATVMNIKTSAGLTTPRGK